MRRVPRPPCSATTPTIICRDGFHVGEILFTFAAELLAPLLALVGGRRGRAIAVAIWTLFQVGIQLTGNFAWLNTASITLGLLFLDDQMIMAVFRRLRLGAWADRFAVSARPISGGKRVDPNALSLPQAEVAQRLGIKSLHRGTRARPARPARGRRRRPTLSAPRFGNLLYDPLGSARSADDSWHARFFAPSRLCSFSAISGVTNCYASSTPPLPRC